ncbi:hypothetical protein HUJ05_009772 [Dendroctonus ponderosae]|nr:hypothetical protein HUJ05_009772 [Dendroctonus ponderosae]
MDGPTRIGMTPNWQQLDRGHPDIRRMINFARRHFFWPGMPDDIERKVKSCSKCAQSAASSVKEPLKPWPEAQKPWTRIHVYFGKPTKGNTLVIEDSYSLMSSPLMKT